MKIELSKYRISFLCMVACIVGAMGCLIIFSREHLYFDYAIIASFAINIALFFVKYIQSVNEYAFSIDQMFWLFSLFFFGFAPLLQFLTGTYSWNLVPTDGEVLRTNIFIFLWSASYIIGQKITLKHKIKLRRRPIQFFRKNTSAPAQDVMQPQYALNYRMKPLLLAATIAVAGFFMVKVGFTNMFSRSTASVSGMSQSMALLVTHGFKNTVLFVAALFVLDAKQKKKITAELMVALLCLLLACFPLSMARNMMASFYAGLLILMFDRTRKGRWFCMVILFGLVLMFPAVEIFRRATTVTSFSDIGPLMIESIQETYLQGHYDAHQMFISIQRYVKLEGFSWGYQLLGCLLFFVPRSLWPAKPYGTGQTAFETLKQHQFTNVSAPLVAESYVNFGVIGIIVIAMLFGKLVKKVDYHYWNSTESLSAIRVIYPFSIFMLFFMQRGDLMSSWAYTFAQIVVGFVLWKVAVTTRVNRSK